MELFASPAVLGGAFMGVAMAAWTLGRWHSQWAQLPDGAMVRVEGQAVQAGPVAAGPFTAERPPAAHLALSAPAACQQSARDERRAAAETADALGELHAEMTAYRLQEQVLTSAVSDGLLVEWLPTRARHNHCRYLGVSGRPTCPGSDTDTLAGACGTGCSAIADRGVAEFSADFASTDFGARRVSARQPASAGLTRV